METLLDWFVMSVITGDNMDTKKDVKSFDWSQTIAGDHMLVVRDTIAASTLLER